MKQKILGSLSENRQKYCFILWSVLILSTGFNTYGQDSVSSGKAFNFPFRKYGLSIGNSREFNGVRLNFADRGTRTINGINVTCWLGDNLDRNKMNLVNGFSFGCWPMAYRMNGLSIGLFGTGVQYMNGIAFGGLAVGSGGTLNGIYLAGIIAGNGSGKNAINGIVISGLMVTSPSKINGIAIGGLWTYARERMNGLAISLTFVQVDNRLSGFGFTPGYLKAGTLNGIGLGGYVNTQKTNGISISLFNRTKELHGLQLGILNNASNNPSLFRWLPLLNFHL